MRKTKVFFILLGIFLFIPFYFSHASVQDEVSQRQNQIEELEKQIQEYQKQIADKQGEARTLENEIFKLNTQIKQLQLEIRSLNLGIEQTGFEIDQTVSQIDQASARIEKLKISLAEFIRLINGLDQESLLEVLLKNKDFSDFFGNLENVRLAQKKAQITISDLKQLKKELEEREAELENKKEELSNLRNIQELQRREVSFKKGEVDSLLKVTRGEEKRFQELVKKSQLDIRRIKEQIAFLLEQGITVEEAIKFGQLAAIRTGIRPEFLLAILEVESKLGANVGKCYIIDSISGASRHITKGTVFTRGIHPSRDLPLFLNITKELGRDPFQTPISCWPGYGWGGAMGPAQFIPSTWVILDKEVARMTGRSPADPWNIEDAFLASALLLAQRGATGKTIAAEEAAAMAYFSGDSRCNTNRNKSLSLRIQCASYANLVILKANELAKEFAGTLSSSQNPLRLTKRHLKTRQLNAPIGSF